MSGFQIPGLGQAKPNETLPPLPADTPTAAASVAATASPPAISGPNATSQPTQDKTDEHSTLRADATPQADDEADAMAVDQPDSPPFLTGALEAALGGLGNTDDAPEQLPPQADGAAPQSDQGEHPEWEIDSSPYESSSELSSSDSSSDEDSGDEGYEPLGVEETARLLMEAEGGSEDEGDRGKGSSAARLRTKNEVAEEIIPKPDITITDDMKIEELGTIENIIDNIMLIKAITPGEYQVLDAGSVLCTAERVVIGAVAETMGKVLQPMYTVYFASEQEIKDSALQVGDKVFYPVGHASYVFTQPLKNIKGSDASNLHDEEVGDDEMEFSDDEREAEYKRSLKQKKKDKWKSKHEAKAGGGGGREAHPSSRRVPADGGLADGGLNYDDDGPYKPLTRPPGFGSGPASGESHEPAPRSGSGRGRDADARGRAGRGRGAGRGGGRGGHGSSSRDGYSLPPQGSQKYSPQNPSQPPAQQAPAPPAVHSLGFQFPAWPQPPAAQAQYPVLPPPPPPGWPAQGLGQAGASNAFVNPAFVAALMSQMQQQNEQQAWSSQQQPPPNGGQSR
ncbi:H/ACA ribonucleoprotein complex, subunit Gar1/Naf1 [Metarhizium album ARSEF 1941]|uniref:H/ACA ribonucleoprotein complex non-core subunit NAF1 n=1 Tax=Metarhizium album (strain ARSEF 1941) TaxID=1081103 RepID=A0A0B2WTP2_METAS|nr:H/ACA ribonucleoprotein complex, subunit Gar1/Naf1 [Metarhizium album ARSEF 1941]KHN97029.1 H/ACA ribonucleoprotein complex, subunit Gar1/Naf1 [Metarhizium album ARSEF 1941]